MIKINKNVLIVLGNGFSIDLVNYLGKGEEIDLINLFSKGDRVLWPANDEPGFLSKLRCPKLWELGVRPNMDTRSAVKIVEDIITCANVSASSTHPSIGRETSSIHIQAYHELVMYLKYLFIYYNEIIDGKYLNEMSIDHWGWAKFFKNLNNNNKIDNVTIVTYNYDIFLERVLKLLEIDYEISGFNSKDCKFKIIKPHGSISFRSKREYDKQNFSIKYNRDSLGGALSDLLVDEKDLNIVSNINVMIPPSGESERYKCVWSKTLKDKVIEYAKQLQEDDDVFFGGVSYCNVDRQEIDDYLIKMNTDVNIKIINPDTSNTFGAVISSIFGNYIHYTNSNILGGLYNG